MTFKRYFLFLLAGALLMFGTFFVGRGAGRFLSPQPVKPAAEQAAAPKEDQPSVESDSSSAAVEEDTKDEAEDEASAEEADEGDSEDEE